MKLPVINSTEDSGGLFLNSSLALLIAGEAQSISVYCRILELLSALTNNPLPHPNSRSPLSAKYGFSISADFFRRNCKDDPRERSELELELELTSIDIDSDDLSFVIYLQVPEELEKELKETEDLHNNSGPGTINFDYGIEMPLSINTFSKFPRVGDIFVFPAWLTHHVHAFKSDVERISVSGNISFDKI